MWTTIIFLFSWHTSGVNVLIPYVKIMVYPVPNVLHFADLYPISSDCCMNYHQLYFRHPHVCFWISLRGCPQLFIVILWPATTTRLILETHVIINNFSEPATISRSHAKSISQVLLMLRVNALRHKNHVYSSLLSYPL